MQYCLLEASDVKTAEKNAEDASYAKLSTLRNAAKRDIVMTQIKTNGGLKSAIETLRSLMYGSNKLGRDNVQTSWHAQRDARMSALANKLFQGGLKKVAESGQLDKDVSVAMFKLSNKESIGSGAASDIAKLYHDLITKLKDDLNKAGANIKEARDYVTNTLHDGVRMRQAAGLGKTPEEAFAAWWNKTQPRLSEKNFYDVAPQPGQTMQDARNAWGRSVFDALVTGVHMVVGEPEAGFVHPDFQGTANVGKKVSAHRTLQWKDGESWHEHMQDFGVYHNLHSSIMMSIDRGTRAMALMDKFGTNPSANLNMLLRRVSETYRADVDGLAKFNGKTDGVKNVMGRLDGSMNIPANMNFATYSAAIRTWESVSSLGGVGITHFASIWPSVSSELVHHGINRIEGIQNTFKALFTGMGDADRRGILSDLGAYADGGTRHIQSVTGEDTIPGHISAMAGKFMDMTGIHVLFDRTKAGVRDLLAHNLGRNIETPFEELSPNLQQMLGKYNITSEDWAALKGAELPKWNDRAYLVPSAAETLRPGLSDKLLSYYSDGAAHAVVSAGVKEKALILGNSRPGTGVGEAARFFAQFKMWPLAAMNQILERDIYMSLSNKEAAFNIGMLVALGVPAGYMRMAANDAIAGRPLRDPRSPSTLLAAAAQSGGLGIMGDFLFGETSRMGGGLVSTLGGPVIGDADTLVKLFNGMKEGKTSWPDIAHFGVRHRPFANLAYVKGSLDYMLWYHLYESASPGWWQRTNSRLQKEQGRTMTGYTPGGGVPYGVPGVYLKNGSGSTGLLGSGAK